MLGVASEPLIAYFLIGSSDSVGLEEAIRKMQDMDVDANFNIGLAQTSE